MTTGRTNPEYHRDLDRRVPREYWWALQALKGAYGDQLTDILVVESRYLADTTGGEPPAAWCGACGSPFFAGEDFQLEPDGKARCRHDAEGYRVGRCFAVFMRG